MSTPVEHPSQEPSPSSVMLAVQRAEALDIFPMAATRIVRIANDPRSSLDDLERAVGTDPALAAQVLKIANSGYFAASRTVASLRDALSMIGFDHTRDLAVALSMAALGKVERPHHRLEWLHALRVGVATMRLAERTGHRSPGELLVIGLLHDLGKLVLLSFDEPGYVQILEGGPMDHLSSREIDAYGFDHAELGSVCVDRWGLPDAVVGAIRHHHHPRLLHDPPGTHAPAEASILALGDRIAYLSAAHRGSLPEELVETVDADPAARPLLDALYIDSGFVAELVAQLDERVSELQLG